MFAEDQPTADSSDIRSQSVTLAQTVFTPALQAALKVVQDRGSRPEAILNGACQGFSQMLSSVLGPKMAVTVLRDIAAHLERNAGNPSAPPGT